MVLINSIGGIIQNDGVSDHYLLPAATTTTLGGVKAGSGLQITSDGTLSATPSSSYVLPKATSSILGGVKVGSNVSVTSDGTISVASPGMTQTQADSRYVQIANQDAKYAKKDIILSATLFADLWEYPDDTSDISETNPNYTRYIFSNENITSTCTLELTYRVDSSNDLDTFIAQVQLLQSLNIVGLLDEGAVLFVALNWDYFHEGQIPNMDIPINIIIRSEN